jgi:hypothetical protein
MYLSSVEMSQLSTDDVSFDWNEKRIVRKVVKVEKDRLEFPLEASSSFHWKFRQLRFTFHPPLIPVSTHLEYAGTVGRSPCVQQVVFARRHEPLAARRESQRENAAFVQVQLVFVGFGGVQDFDVGVLHADSKPIA